MPNKSLKLDLLLGPLLGSPFLGDLGPDSDRVREGVYPLRVWGPASPSLAPRPRLPAEACAHRARRPPAPGCQCLPPALP